MRNQTRIRRSLARLAPVILLPFLASCAGGGALHSAGTNTPPVTVGVIAINDFHGSLEPPRQSVAVADGKGGMVQVPAGGAAWLASAVDTVRAKYPNHLTVAAGDLISASQLSSSLYLDEPAIGVANRIGLDFNAVGNHEFDRGRKELQRMQTGGCEQNTPRQPCQVEPFTGAQFGFLAASTMTETGQTLFPATALKSFGKGRRRVTVGLIGLTLQGTPSLVAPGGIKGLTFLNEAATINRLVPALKVQGADAVVVLIHQGGGQDGISDPNDCKGLTGEIRPILDQLDPGVDLVVSGHTHRAYVCDYGALNPAHPVLLTSAGVYGELVSDITLEIDPIQHRVVGKRAVNVVVQSAPFTGSKGVVANTALVPQFAPRADVAAYVATYVDAAKSLTHRAVGKLSGAASGRPLGQLIADAQLAATRDAGAQIALMNPFGVRAALVPASDGSLTFDDIYTAQPFNNTLVTQSFIGAELKAILEQGFDANGPEQILLPSAGFAFRYDRSRAVGDRITSLTLDGAPIDPAVTYRVTTNSFLAQGGDSFTLFAKGRDAVIGMSDLAALEAWLKGDQLRSVPSEERSGEAGR